MRAVNALLIFAAAITSLARLLVIGCDASLAKVHALTMRLLQIDFTPAIVVLGLGCVIAVALKLVVTRAQRLASERSSKILRELDALRSRTE